MADLYRQTTGEIAIELENRYQDELEAFNTNDISTCDLLSMDPRTVSKLSGISVLECDTVAHALEEEIANLISVETLDIDCAPLPRISSGVEGIDRVLGGGFPVSTVSEIAGESAAGKSHFLLQLCVNVQLPSEHGGLGKRAIFISTESGLETRRLIELLDGAKTMTGCDSMLSLDHVSHVACKDLDDQEQVLQYQLPALLETGGFGLVVVDSITAHFRGEEFAKKELSVRDKRLLRSIHHLKGLARQHSVAVVFANQISALFGSELSLPIEQLPILLDMQLPHYSGWKKSVIIPADSPRFKRKHVDEEESRSDDLSSSQSINLTLNSSQISEGYATQPMPNSSPSSSYDATASSDHLSQATNFGSSQVFPLRATTIHSKMPALGQWMANAVDLRAVVKHFSMPHESEVTRTFEVVFSTLRFSNDVVRYEIASNGLITPKETPEVL